MLSHALAVVVGNRVEYQHHICGQDESNDALSTDNSVGGKVNWYEVLDDKL